MKANFTKSFKATLTAIVFAATFFGLSHNAGAQAAFQGGVTYYVDGNGTDLVAPKDTFLNLTGAYTLNSAYTTTTGLLPALTMQGVDVLTLGTITIQLAPGYASFNSGAGYVEPNSMILGDAVNGAFPGMSLSRPIVLKTTPGIDFTLKTSLSISGTSSLFRLNGVQFFTLDGQGTIGQNNLTLQMPAVAITTTKVIDIIPFTNNGCQSITIQNCNIIGYSNNASIYNYAGIFLGGSANGNALRKSLNITIQNNNILAVNNGIVIRGYGTLSLNHDLGLIIRGNIIGGLVAPGGSFATNYIGGAANCAGILLSAQANALVENNVVRNSLNSAGTGGGFRGIALTTDAGTLSLDSNITITRNKIYNIISQQASTGSYGIRINLGSHTQPLNIAISNNTIANISHYNGTPSLGLMYFPVGICIEDVSANVGLSIVHNSINLYGSVISSGGFSACIATGASVNGGIVLKNNILANRMGRISTNTTGSTNYGIVCNSTTAATPHPFSSIDGNNYYINTFDGGNAFLGFSAVGNRQFVSINHWRNFLAFISGDVNSKTAIPPFTSDTLLELNGSTASVLSNSGVAGTGITVDINNTARTSTPSVGAYQFNAGLANANIALTGGVTYPVNGSPTQGPTTLTPTIGNFATMSDAITYLNAYGTSGSGGITLQLTSTYAGEGNNYMPAFIDYPGASGSRAVTITPANGVKDTLTIPNRANFNYCAVLRFIGAKFVNIDGNNLNLNIVVPPLANNATTRVIAITPSDQSPTTNLGITKCVITGCSDNVNNYTFAGIFVGHHSNNAASALSGRNDNHTITYNLIQAVKNGIYYRGASIVGMQDQNIYIGYNTIGGINPPLQPTPTTYVGGAVGQAGIFIKSMASSFIEGNIIRNSMNNNASFYDFRGIDLSDAGEAAAGGRDSNVYVMGNKIYNLTSTSFGNIGIRVNLGADSLRRISLSNNYIGKIQGTGANAQFSLNNPCGIMIDGTGNINTIGIELYYNTVQLSGNTLTGTGSSTCLYVGASIQGGLKVQNNLFVNRLGRTSAFAGYAYAISCGAASGVNPFKTFNSVLNNNVYFAGALNTNNFLGSNIGGLTNIPTLGNTSISGTWRYFTTQDANSYWHPVSFVNDTLPNVQIANAGPVSYGGGLIPGVLGDIYGTIRFGQPGYNLVPSGTAPCVGAVEFAQTYSPLVGGATYYINGLPNNPPLKSSPTVGSFTTINRAIQHLVSNGVDGITAPANPINLIITSPYAGEADTLITPFSEYPNMNANRVVILKSDAPRTITSTGIANPYGNAASVIRFNGASYVTIDGSSNGTNSRDLTITLPANTSANQSLKVIDIVPGNLAPTNITIKNCNILGSSTTTTINTFAGIYSGGVSTTAPTYIGNPLLSGSNNNSFINNFIGGVRYGIYLRGASAIGGQQDLGNVIRANNIGGDIAPSGSQPTNYFGGQDFAAGILLSSQAAVTVDSNIIKNCITTNNQVRGIELSAVSGTVSTDSVVTISRNMIYKLNSSTAAIWGIYINLGAPVISRNITIVNNWISGLSSAGTSASPTVSMFNPSGIYVDASSIVQNLGLNIWFNSINLGTTGGTNAALSASSCVQFSALIRGGISLRNNILQNRLPRLNSGNTYSVLVGANQNIFTTIDNNNYFTNATGSGTNYLMGYNAASSVSNIGTLPALSAFTSQDTASISFVTPFASDTTLTLPLFSSSVLVGGGSFIPSVPYDIFGQYGTFSGRSLSPTIGAVEFSGSPSDSVAPKLYNYSSLGCGNGPFTIDMRAYEANVASDTLYYVVNGVMATAPVSFVNGTTRQYIIPAQASNTLIQFRVSLNDIAGRNATYPAVGSWDTIVTSISSFPYAYGFEGPNVSKWTVQQISGTGGWILGSTGTSQNPTFSTAKSGVKMALFGNNTTPYPAGTASRLVSPSFDLTYASLPTLRFWVTQSDANFALKDTVLVRISTGGGAPGTWTMPLTIVVRPNLAYPFTDWRQVDVCLADYVGTPCLKVAIEAYSRGGNSMFIDSITMLDNSVSTPVTPLTNTICGYDSLTLNITNSSSSMAYTMYNIFTASPISAEYFGNNGTLTMRAANPNLDSVGVNIFVRNALSTNSGSCWNFMHDTATVYIKLFKNGPFVTQGTPFDGAFNAGTIFNPDAAKVGDVLTYTIVPPSGLTNADFGSKWTIPSIPTIKTFSGQVASNATYTAPTLTANGSMVMNVGAADGDSTFYLNVRFKLLPSNCDSLVVRAIKITSVPTSTFTNGGKDTACAGAYTFFNYAMPQFPSNLPYTYAWDFGDGTTSNNSGFMKRYTTPGVYTVKLTVFNNASLSSFTTKSFRVLPSPTSGYTNSKPCSGDTVVFSNSSTSATSYIWNYTSLFTPVSSGSSNVASPHFYLSTPNNDTGTFNVTLVAVNSLGCTDTTTKFVQLFAKPIAAFTVTNHCLGTKATMVNNSTIAGNTNSFGSLWYMGDGDSTLSSSPTYYYKNNNTYTIRLIVTSNYGCQDSAKHTVTVYDKPRTGFTYDATTTCMNSNVAITDTSKYGGVLASSKMLYLWDFGDNSVYSADFAPVHSYGATGTYQLKIVAMDTVHYCTDSTVKNITISTTPVAQFEMPNGGCVGNPVQFTNKTASLVTDSVKYLWNFGDASVTDTVTSPLHTYLAPGSYTVSLKATALTGCNSSASKVLSVSSSPVVTIAKTYLGNCKWRFVASSSIYSSYIWTLDNNSELAYRDTIEKTITGFSGYHKMVLKVTDGNGCQGTTTDSIWSCAVGVKEISSSQYDVKVHPNPFTDATNISYTLDKSSNVHIRVFDMIGRMVADIDNGNQTSGIHSTILDADKFSGNSAAYLVRIQIDDQVITRQIIRMK